MLLVTRATEWWDPSSVDPAVSDGSRYRVRCNGVEDPTQELLQSVGKSDNGCVYIRKIVVKRVTSDTVVYCITFRLFVVIVVLP